MGHIFFGPAVVAAAGCTVEGTRPAKGLIGLKWLACALCRFTLATLLGRETFGAVLSSAGADKRPRLRLAAVGTFHPTGSWRGGAVVHDLQLIRTREKTAVPKLSGRPDGCGRFHTSGACAPGVRDASVVIWGLRGFSVWPRMVSRGFRGTPVRT